MIEQQKSDLEGLDRAFSESKEEVGRCEEMIHQLTKELENTQNELRSAYGRVKEVEEANRDLKERVQEVQHQVGSCGSKQ